MAEKKAYDVILFDADRTLYDFDRGEEQALRVLLDGFGLSLTPEMLGRYREINKELWDAFDRGEIEKSTIAPTRFRRFFAGEGIGLDPDAAAKRYMSLLGEQRFLMSGAMEICQGLFGSYDMYIVTNGMGDVQLSRFSKSEIAPFFKGIFISETLGAAKPQREFYDRVFEKLGIFDRSRVLVVGDSPTADILGANRAGIDACYFSPSGEALPEGIYAKYTVKALEELTALFA